jgi:hypothetical protein
LVEHTKLARKRRDESLRRSQDWPRHEEKWHGYFLTGPWSAESAQTGSRRRKVGLSVKCSVETGES